MDRVQWHSANPNSRVRGWVGGWLGLISNIVNICFKPGSRANGYHTSNVQTLRKSYAVNLLIDSLKCIYIHTHTHTHTHIYIYIYIPVYTTPNQKKLGQYGNLYLNTKYFMFCLVNFMSFVNIHPFLSFRPATHSKKVGTGAI